MDRSRALVVDDNASLGETVADILSDEGYEVEVVASGAQALIAWRARPAQLVVLDVDLPDIGGIRVARRLAGRGGCGLVVMSARERGEMRPRCREMGAVFLPKPFAPAQLLAAVRLIRRRRRLARAERRAHTPRRLLGPRKPRGLLELRPWRGMLD